MSNYVSGGRIIFYFLILIFELIALCANAQVPQDREGLLNGEGAGFGQSAEMKGYPGPKHVLDLADKLKLTDAQKQSVQGTFTGMKTRAKELGEGIIRIEEELDDALGEGLVSEKAIRDDCEQIGRLRGRFISLHT